MKYLIIPEKIFAYLGLFISSSALMYFVHPVDAVATIFGGVIVLFYKCYEEIRDEKKPISKLIFPIFMYFVAVTAICFFSIRFFQPWIDSLNIYKWFIVIGFIIATAGTIIPIANEKGQPTLLKVIYYTVLFVISLATIIKAPESFQFNSEKNLSAKEIQLIDSSLDKNQSNNKNHENAIIKTKLNKLNQGSELDQFILCISLIMAGLTLVYWSNILKVKREETGNAVVS